MKIITFIFIIKLGYCFTRNDINYYTKGAGKQLFIIIIDKLELLNSSELNLNYNLSSLQVEICACELFQIETILF